MKHFLLLTFSLLLWLTPGKPVLAQTVPTAGTFACGTINLTPAQAQSLVKAGKQALQQKQATTNGAATSITYVPIRPHIVRRSNGTGGYPLANLNEAMATTNSYFLLNGFGIQFYFAGATPDYIDDDDLYEGFTNPPSGRDAINAMNQYYINVFPPDIQLGGYAGFPADNVASTRSVIRTYGSSSNGQSFHFGYSLIPHELGHNFGLYHTFGFGSGNMPTDELVTRGPGANCETNGDFICDTPADPYGVSGANTILVNNCYQYDPNSTARDANGDPYNPSLTNLMSYWSSCTRDFTPGQYSRIQEGLALRQTHTSYTLNAPATNVNPVTNLTATMYSFSAVLTWQDNATNEMGYFIERSTSPDAGFVPIGGVAPDVTTFTDPYLEPNSRYYYRIRPSNTTTGNLSSTTSVSTCPVPLYPGSNPARISALLYWNGNAGETYAVRWRPAGSSQWTTINNIPANGQYSTSSYSLTGLTASTAYEWQVQRVCSVSVSSDFTDIKSFTTSSCQTPGYGTTSIAGAESVYFFWYNYYEESSRTADIQYRAVGTPNWTTISGVSSVSNNASYTLTSGLTNNTTYEWQVRNVCSATEQSGYTSLTTFTTSCPQSGTLTSMATATGATLNWRVRSLYDAGSTFDVQYRPVGSTVWSTVGNIAGGSGSDYTGYSTVTYSLTGLTTNTQYEWQVRTHCTANTQSAYSATAQFTTVCNPPNGFGLGVSLKTSTSVQFRWNSNNAVGTPHDIRYRPVGAPDWITVSTANTTIFGGSYDLTGLTNNTTYEWQIRSACSPAQISAFVAGPNFTTQCPIPLYPYASILVTSAVLNWQQAGVDVTYDAQYRKVGTANWTTISHIASTSVNITGLTGSTSYEWQVRTLCADGSTTDFTTLLTFTTDACSMPNTLQTNLITVNSAQMSWYFGYANADTGYQGRYRAVGAANWILLDGLTSINLAGTFLLTGLSNATDYEWQIRTLCSASESSGFTNSVYFQTLSPCPAMYTVRDGLWSDPSVWSCNRLPVAGDVVQIKHVVIIPASYVAIARQVGVDSGQKVSYGTSAQLRVGF